MSIKLEISGLQSPRWVAYNCRDGWPGFAEIHNDKFGISQKTFKRDIEVIKIAVTSIFNDDARMIKIKDKLAYKLFVPYKPYLLF